MIALRSRESAVGLRRWSRRLTDGRSLDWHATAQATSREIEELVDYTQCARRARGDAGGRLVLDHSRHLPRMILRLRTPRI